MKADRLFDDSLEIYLKHMREYLEQLEKRNDLSNSRKKLNEELKPVTALMKKINSLSKLSLTSCEYRQNLNDACLGQNLGLSDVHPDALQDFISSKSDNLKEQIRDLNTQFEKEDDILTFMFERQQLSFEVCQQSMYLLEDYVFQNTPSMRYFLAQIAFHHYHNLNDFDLSQFEPDFRDSCYNGFNEYLNEIIRSHVFEK